MLTKRQNMIISIMNRQKDWIIGKDLARLLNVSNRYKRPGRDSNPRPPP